MEREYSFRNLLLPNHRNGGSVDPDFVFTRVLNGIIPPYRCMHFPIFLSSSPIPRSLEKSKLVYVLNRNALGKLFPSSPLEAHKNNALISAMIGVDVGFDNPMYACLETGYEESDADWTGEAFQNVEKVGLGGDLGEARYWEKREQGDREMGLWDR